ncbi:DUF2218 domain-containing protein [Shimia sp. CNT1-13L.2]|uniref:DUF2218 domain-containing protein n=1 Tax=Shimia sp. CNT1-13L.2 TaxID=2959663 RepID=UPI0020CEBE99|nr:DUF2218 domain-containing protein [Shimia sp. CNT1-13L.2]MCP9484105.1 DUF2218 domain-containing protein [Shimia sp. CNT1-13L.2]
MRSNTGTFETEHASKYLQQLCKHFAHKTDVVFDAEKADVVFPFGSAKMLAAKDKLTVTVSAEDDETLSKARVVIDKHLERFAFRENFSTMAWCAA